MFETQSNSSGVKSPRDVFYRSKSELKSDSSADYYASPPESITKLVRNADLAAATARQKPTPWTKNMFQLYFCILVGSFACAINGYNSTVLGSINSYEQYRTYFGFDPKSGAPATGLVYSIYAIGGIVGFVLTGPAADYKGRRWGMCVGAGIIFLFSIVSATSQNLAQFMASRFMIGLGNAISASGPIYVSEMAHPAYRGVIGGIYNSFWYIGSIPAAFIPYGTSGIDGTGAWRIPIWFQLVFSGLLCGLSPFLPESPRWLIANNRKEEALDILGHYHGDGDKESAIVQLEYTEMLKDISQEGSDKRWWDYRELFNTRETRYRLMLLVVVTLIAQCCGNAPISYFYPTVLSSSGITSQNTLLLLNGFQALVSYAGALLGAAFTDKWGRRRQLITVTTLFVFILIITISLDATNIYTDKTGVIQAISQSQGKAVVAFTLLFGFVYSVGFTPLQILYPLEVLRFETRAKGMGCLQLLCSITQFYNMFVTEIAFDNISWRYYFVFIFFDIAAVIFMYFFFVETSNRTLEELTEIFRSEYPVKTSLAKSKIIIQGDEIIVHVQDTVY